MRLVTHGGFIKMLHICCSEMAMVTTHPNQRYRQKDKRQRKMSKEEDENASLPRKHRLYQEGWQSLVICN